MIVIGAMFFCGTFSVTSNSRMMYAFARDGAIPGARFFHKVDKKTQSPVRTGASPPSIPSPPSLRAVRCVDANADADANGGGQCGSR